MTVTRRRVSEQAGSAGHLIARYLRVSCARWSHQSHHSHQKQARGTVRTRARDAQMAHRRRNRACGSGDWPAGVLEQVEHLPGRPVAGRRRGPWAAPPKHAQNESLPVQCPVLVVPPAPHPCHAAGADASIAVGVGSIHTRARPPTHVHRRAGSPPLARVRFDSGARRPAFLSPTSGGPLLNPSPSKHPAPRHPRHDPETERKGKQPTQRAVLLAPDSDTHLQGEWIPSPGQWPVGPQDDVDLSSDRIWIDGCFDFSHHGRPARLLVLQRTKPQHRS